MNQQLKFDPRGVFDKFFFDPKIRIKNKNKKWIGWNHMKNPTSLKQ